MMTAKFSDTTLQDLAQSLSERGEPYAIATVIRTVGLTAAKPGAKAILNHEGQIIEEKEPEEFFNNPENERTQLFLSQILDH